MKLATRIGAQRPRLSSIPHDIDNTAAGDEVIEFAAYCGLHLDDWQQWCVRHICAERSDGSWAATQSVLIVPRQSGKSAIIEAIEMAALFLWEEEHIIYSAHLGKTAADHQRRIRRLIEGRPEFKRQGRVLTGKGDERVELWSGAILEFITRGKKSSRGGSPSRVFFDEAMFLTDDQTQAMLPALSAQSMNEDHQAQMVYASSAPIAESQVLHRLRDRGIEGTAPRLFFAEWSAPEDCDPADRQNWYDANPGLGIRISEEWIEDNEFGTMSIEGFGTERLGIPVPPERSGGDGIIPEGLWRSCADPTAKPAGLLAYSIDASPDLRSASIAVSDGRMVAVAEHHPGVAWLPEKLAELIEDKPGAVHLDPKGPIGALLVDLGDQGIEWDEITPAEHAQACGGLLGAVLKGEGFHHVDQPALNAAVAGATRRNYADAWVWNRRTAGDDICPLVAVTIARWAALQAEHDYVGPLVATT
ncbi:MAG TPA: hypothetical protein VFK52_10845 [Nocardioidaceae bacterium]|nr:hypothetical protein [Nocardioidaceae bacterium]